MFQTALNITDLSILTDNSTKAVHMFPSVRTGPVDISKAQELLDFTPTPWKTAVAETVDFYEKAMTNPYFHIYAFHLGLYFLSIFGWFCFASVCYFFSQYFIMTT